MSSVDPRIEDRRDAVRRQRRRSLLFRLSLMGVVALAVIGALALTRSPLLDVDKVTVAGAPKSGDDAVIAAAGVALGDPMTDVDTSAARAAVSELPWVATAEIRREWPATVTIEITERVAVAAIPLTEGVWALVDREGRILDDDSADPGELVELAGVAMAAPGEEIDASALLAVSAGVPTELRSRIASASEAEDQVELQLAPVGRILIGPASRLGEKFLALRTVLAQVDDRCIDLVDLRVPRRPTITRDAACVGPADPVAVDLELEVPGGVGGGEADPVDGLSPEEVPDEGPGVDDTLPISPDGFPIHPVTGLPYDPALGMQWDPVTGLPVHPGTGEPYDPFAEG